MSISVSDQVIVWQYRVKPEAVEAFEKAYGTGGDWDSFFAGARGFKGTDLLRGYNDPCLYVTIDRWDSVESRDAYVESRRAEYDALDARFEELTIEELRLI